MKEIFLGKPPGFPGLIPLVRTYLDMIGCDPQTREVVDRYLNLIRGRVTGELMTLATWLRHYVAMHPSYKQDSALPPDLVHDLLETCWQITHGKVEVPELLGKLSPVNGDSKQPIASTEEPSEEERGPMLKGAKADGPRLLLRLPDKQGCEKFMEYLTKHLRDCGTPVTEEELRKAFACCCDPLPLPSPSVSARTLTEPAAAVAAVPPAAAAAALVASAPVVGAN